MSNRKEKIIADLERSQAFLQSVTDRLTPEQWESPVQESDQRWTARQVFSHLLDAKKGMIGQARRISIGQEGVPADFDLDRWNKRTVEKMREKPVVELLTEMDQADAALKTFVAEIPEPDLDRTGRHSSLVIMSVETMLLLIASHQTDHTQGIIDAFKL